MESSPSAATYTNLPSGLIAMPLATARGPTPSMPLLSACSCVSFPVCWSRAKDTSEDDPDATA